MRRPRSVVMAVALLLGTGCRTGSAAPAEERDRALVEARKGNPVVALRMLRAAVERNPGDSVAYTELADLYRRYGWSSDGYQYFRERAARPGEGLPELRYYAAAFAAFAGHGDDAERWLRAAAVRRHPTEAEALAIAEALTVIGREASARSLLEGAARNYPDRFEPQARFAISLADAGDTARAARVMDAALRRFPNEPRVLGVAAELRFLVGDLAGSEEFTHRWLALSPKNAEARWNLTRIALRRANYSLADSLLLLTAQTGR